MTSESKYRKMNKKLHWGRGIAFGKKSPKLKRIAFFTSADRASMKADTRKNSSNEDDMF